MDDPQDNGTDQARHPSGQAPAPSLAPPPPPTAQSSQAEAVASSQGIPDQPAGRFAQVGTANISTASTRSRKRSRSPEDDPMQAFKRHARKVREEIETANRRSLGIAPNPSATEASKGNTSQSTKRPASRSTAKPSSTSAANPPKLGFDQTQEAVSEPKVAKPEPSLLTVTKEQLEGEKLRLRNLELQIEAQKVANDRHKLDIEREEKQNRAQIEANRAQTEADKLRMEFTLRSKDHELKENEQKLRLEEINARKEQVRISSRKAELEKHNAELAVKSENARLSENNRIEAEERQQRIAAEERHRSDILATQERVALAEIQAKATATVEQGPSTIVQNIAVLEAAQAPPPPPPPPPPVLQVTNNVTNVTNVANLTVPEGAVRQIIRPQSNSAGPRTRQIGRSYPPVGLLGDMVATLAIEDVRLVRRIPSQPSGRAFEVQSIDQAVRGLRPLGSPYQMPQGPPVAMGRITSAEHESDSEHSETDAQEDLTEESKIS